MNRARRGSLGVHLPALFSQTVPLEHQVFLPLVAAPRRPHGPSKLGVHTIHPNGAMDELIEPVSAAGGRVALVKALDDIGYLGQVKAVSPQTVCVARRNLPDYTGFNPDLDPIELARTYMAEHMSYWDADRENVDYWEVLNEPDPPETDGHRKLAEFHLECMSIAEQNGYKLALFSYSVGVPEWEEWEAIVETGVFQQAQAGGHILALHEYNWPNVDYRWGEALPGHPAYPDRGVLTGRYRHLYEDFLIPRDQVIPLAITEAGYDPSVFGQGWDSTWKLRYVAEMGWYDDRLREDDYVIGCALFTLGGGGSLWGDWDYEDLLPDLAERIIALKDDNG
jgi:hypothetical protein